MGLSYWVVIDSLRSFFPINLYLCLILATSLPAAYALLRGEFNPSIPKFDRSDAVILLLVAFQTVVLSLYFWQYPFFPQLDSIDFPAHLQYVSQFATGGVPAFGTALFYNGIHFLLSIAVLGDSELQMLFAVRAAMAILIVISDFILYYFCSRIFRTADKTMKNAPLWGCAIYVLSGFVWLNLVLGSGLYPNFYGLLSSLLLLGVSIDVSESNFSASASSRYAILGIAFANSLFSHYSVLFVMPAVLLYFGFIKRIGALLLVSISLAAIALVFEGTFISLLNFLGSGGPINGLAPVSQDLSFWPVLGYIASSIAANGVYGSAYALTTIASVIAFVVLAVRDRGRPALLLVWLLPILVAAPFSSAAWRFSFVALMPITLMTAYVLALATRQRSYRLYKKVKRQVPAVYKTVALLFLALSLAGSQSGQVVAQFIAGGTASNLQQQSDYQAMVWIDQNTPSNDTIISVSDWRFAFVQTLGGPAVFHSFENVNASSICAPSGPSVVLQYASQVNSTLIVVTDNSTLADCTYLLRPWLTFSPQTLGCQDNCTVYENSEVRVFQVG